MQSIARYGGGAGMINAYMIVIWNMKGKKPFKKWSRLCKDNIKTDLNKRVWKCGYDSIVSGQNPVAGPYEHGNEQAAYEKSKVFSSDERLSLSQGGLSSAHLITNK